VTSIGLRAFENATGLTSVSFQAGSALLTIETEAFEASGLTSVVIPKSVTSIGVRAFQDASDLTSVTFEAGSSLRTIDQEAFRRVSGVTSIVIPDSVTSIGVRALQGATALASVTFEGNAPTVGSNAFSGVASGATANVGFAATGFEPVVSGRWQGLVLVRAADPSAPVAAASDPVGPQLGCTPDGALTVGAPVTCTVSGGDPGIDILWRAAYNPVIAEQGVTLDANGSGVFSFVVPAAAVGEVITVELVEWLAPVSLGTADGPTPASVPTGSGPVPVWPVLLLALAGGLALRRRSGSGWPPLRVS
jgi:MYXO-CTERM domain-containing protein